MKHILLWRFLRKVEVFGFSKQSEPFVFVKTAIGLFEIFGKNLPTKPASQLF